MFAFKLVFRQGAPALRNLGRWRAVVFKDFAATGVEQDVASWYLPVLTSSILPACMMNILHQNSFAAVSTKLRYSVFLMCA